MCAHQSLELLNHAFQQTQSVVLSESTEKVLENVALVTAGNLLQFLDDLLLVANGEGGGVQDRGELGVLLEDFAELCKGLGDLVEGGGFGRGSVLDDRESKR